MYLEMMTFKNRIFTFFMYLNAKVLPSIQEK